MADSVSTASDKQAQNRAYIDSFLSYLKDVQGYSEKTVISYAHDLKRLDEFLVSHDLGVSEMVYEDARAFVADLYDQNLSHASINRILSGNRMFFDVSEFTRRTSSDSSAEPGVAAPVSGEALAMTSSIRSTG